MHRVTSFVVGFRREFVRGQRADRKRVHRVRQQVAHLAQARADVVRVAAARETPSTRSAAKSARRPPRRRRGRHARRCRRGSRDAVGASVARRVAQRFGGRCSSRAPRRGGGRRPSALAERRTRRNSPMPPQTLKLTQVSVGKWNATYQLAMPMNAKNATHAQVRRVQTGCRQRDVLHQVGEQVAAEGQAPDRQDRAEQRRRAPSAST